MTGNDSLIHALSVCIEGVDYGVLYISLSSDRLPEIIGIVILILTLLITALVFMLIFYKYRAYR